MKVILYKSDNEKIEVRVKKILIMNEEDQPVGIAQEITPGHYAIAHTADEDFLPILLQSGYQGKLPKVFKLKQRGPTELYIPN